MPVDSLPLNLRELRLITAAERTALIPTPLSTANIIVFDTNGPQAIPYRMSITEFLSSLTIPSPTVDTPTFTGAFKSTATTLTGAGAVPLTSLKTNIVSTGANALTLADGVDGQVKILTMKTDGGDATLTPTTKTGFSTITFNDAGDSCMLTFTTGIGWTIVGQNGCTVA